MTPKTKTKKESIASAKSRKPDVFWIYGLHAVCAALENTQRTCHELIYLSPETLNSLAPCAEKKSYDFSQRPHLVVRHSSRLDFDRLFGQNAVHQGVGLKVSCLPSLSLEDFLQKHQNAPTLNLATLDQVTDPHNLGAVARSAAAFGIQALLIPERHSPPENSAVLYKAASGALECLPLIRVPNLARALEVLQKEHFWNFGFTETEEKTLDLLDPMLFKGRVNFIFGAEGQGLRRLTKDLSDVLVGLPTVNHFKTLNVSNAAAIAFYELHRHRKSNPLPSVNAKGTLC